MCFKCGGVCAMTCKGGATFKQSNEGRVEGGKKWKKEAKYAKGRRRKRCCVKLTNK